jgi:nucleoid DNA-binding protein
MATKKMEKPLTKTELLTGIAEETGLAKKDVAAVLVSLEDSIKKSLGRTGCGKFVLPGLVKVETVKAPARKARKGVPNPFKPGELMDVKAKPASTKIKVRALKSLKDM